MLFVVVVLVVLIRETLAASVGDGTHRLSWWNLDEGGKIHNASWWKKTYSPSICLSDLVVSGFGCIFIKVHEATPTACCCKCVCLDGGEIRGIFDNAENEKGYATANNTAYMENPRCRVSSGKVTRSVFCLIETTICVSKDKSLSTPRNIHGAQSLNR